MPNFANNIFYFIDYYSRYFLMMTNDFANLVLPTKKMAYFFSIEFSIENRQSKKMPTFELIFHFP